MEVLAKAFVHNIPGRNPGPLLRAIALPIDQVLQAASDTAGIEEPADREHRPTINDAGGRWGLGDRGMR